VLALIHGVVSRTRSPWPRASNWSLNQLNRRGLRGFNEIGDGRHDERADKTNDEIEHPGKLGYEVDNFLEPKNQCQELAQEVTKDADDDKQQTDALPVGGDGLTGGETRDEDYDYSRPQIFLHI